MKFLIKIFLLPINIVLGIITLFLTFVMNIGAFALNLLSIVAIFGFIAAIIKGNTFVAIQAITIAYLLSPYGLPMVGYVIIEFIKKFNSFLLEI